MRDYLFLLLAVVGSACHPIAGSAATTRAAGPRHCHYDVVLTDATSGQLEVEVRCSGGEVNTFIANEESIAHLTTARLHDGQALIRHGNRFDVPAAATGPIHYAINLDAAARQANSIDVVYKAGPAWVAAGSSWLLQPQPLRADTRVTVAVRTPANSGFASGMKRDDSGNYTILARRLHSATYGVFGAFREEGFSVPGPFAFMPAVVTTSPHSEKARIKVVVLPGDLTLTMDQLTYWLREAAMAVGRFWGGFPVDDVCILVIPKAGYDRVVHGKVVSAGGPTIALQVGAQLDPSRLHDDWIVVHELFHLGFPTFPHVNKWLDEGLATYYEPVIRARVGWRSEQDLWQELTYDMPQGLAAMERQGLDNSQDYRDIYWGGAMLAFVADVRIRERTQNRLGLEDGLRAVLARGGHAGTVWTIDKAVSVVDRAVGVSVLGTLVAKHRKQGTPVGFDNILKELGVARSDDGVVLDGNASLAPIRNRIVRPLPQTVDAP